MRITVDYDDGKVVIFREKKSACSAGRINGAVYLLNKTAADAFPKDQERFSVERDVFPKDGKAIGIKGNIGS